MGIIIDYDELNFSHALLIITLFFQGTHKVTEKVITMNDLKRAIKENRVSYYDSRTIHHS